MPLQLQKTSRGFSQGYHFSSLKQIDFKRASGMIRFFAGNCLSGLGLVMKEP
jgi:hypothetical protein